VIAVRRVVKLGPVGIGCGLQIRQAENNLSSIAAHSRCDLAQVILRFTHYRLIIGNGKTLAMGGVSADSQLN
jgi:hypothetical protein